MSTKALPQTLFMGSSSYAVQGCCAREGGHREGTASLPRGGAGDYLGALAELSLRFNWLGSSPACVPRGDRTIMRRRHRKFGRSVCQPFFLDSPNLAKGDFWAKYSCSAVQSSEKSAHYTGQNARNAALSGREVRTMRGLRRFEHPRGVNPSKSAVESRQSAQSNGQSELLMHASASLKGRSVSTWPKNRPSLG